MARPIPCTTCILGEELCPRCDQLERVSLREVPRKVVRERGEELENPELEVVGAGEEDGGASDTSDLEDGEDVQGKDGEDEGELAPSSVVWARTRPRGPVCLSEGSP